MYKYKTSNQFMPCVLLQGVWLPLLAPIPDDGSDRPILHTYFQKPKSKSVEAEMYAGRKCHLQSIFLETNSARGSSIKSTETDSIRLRAAIAAAMVFFCQRDSDLQALNDGLLETSTIEVPSAATLSAVLSCVPFQKTCGAHPAHASS